MAGKMSPDAWAAQQALWARERRELETTCEQLKARLREENERRRRLRRLLLLARCTGHRSDRLRPGGGG